MSSRIPNPDLVDPDRTTPYQDEDSARNVPEAERHARLTERLHEAELELLIQASALRLQGLALARGSSDDDAEIA